MHKFTKIIRCKKPCLIITHSEDEKHFDHIEISKTVKQSAWKANEEILPELGACHKIHDVWCFECVDIIDKPDFIVDVTNTFSKKQKALKCYESQNNIISGIQNHILGMSLIRGYQIGVNHAEAFKRISMLPCEVKL